MAGVVPLSRRPREPRCWTSTPCLVLVYLFLPIFVIILYSFNKPEGKFNFVWKSFSLDAWRDPFKYPPLVEAMKLSLKVAAALDHRGDPVRAR